MKHNIKRVREEKTNTRIFTWFGYPRLRPRLQAHPLEDFTIEAFPRLQRLQLTSKVSMNLYNKRLYLQSLHSSVSHTCTLTIWWKWKLQQKLSLRVDLQMIAQWRFNLWRSLNLKLNISCVHLFVLAWITKNELALSLYSLNSKTSRYSHSGRIRLAV